MKSSITIVIVAALLIGSIGGCNKKETYTPLINKVNINTDEAANALALGNYREEKEGTFINYYDLKSNKYLGFKNIKDNTFTDSMGNKKSIYIKGNNKESQQSNLNGPMVPVDSNQNVEKEKVLNKSNFIQYGKLFSTIKSKFPKKTEFETLEAYQGRCSNACIDEYMVKIDLGDFRKRISFSYNADRQLITFSIPKSIGAGTSSKTLPRHGIEVSDFQKTGKSKGSYLGSNAFGATRTVKVVDIDYDIISPQPDIYPKLSFDFKCDPDTAKKIQGNFAIAVSFNIDCKRNVESLATTEKQYSSPTMSAPYSGTSSYNIIPVIIKAVFIYDQKNYKVLTSKTF